jgi:hypothetical protein
MYPSTRKTIIIKKADTSLVSGKAIASISVQKQKPQNWLFQENLCELSSKNSGRP